MKEIDNTKEHDTEATAGSESIVEGSILPDEHNILRKKTFSPELKELVSRIKTNEGDTEPERVESISESNVLINLHRLFYKTKNLGKLNTINSEFNPFQIDYSVNDFHDELNRHVSSRLKEISLPVYSFLTYKVDERCYSTSIKGQDGFKDIDLIINLKDRLYETICNNRCGFILKQSDIIKDDYLVKKFKLPESEDVPSLYFIHVGSFTDTFRSELRGEEILNKIYDKLSPILVLEVTGDEWQNEEEIFKKLESEFSLPMFLLEENKSALSMLRPEQDPGDLIYFIDGLLNAYLTGENETAALIIPDKIIKKENLYIWRYLHSKLIKELISASLIINMKNNRIFIIAGNDSINVIHALVDDFNKLYTCAIKVEILTYVKKNNIPAFARAICL